MTKWEAALKKRPGNGCRWKTHACSSHITVAWGRQVWQKGTSRGRKLGEIVFTVALNAAARN